MATDAKIILSAQDRTRAAFESAKRNVLGLKTGLGSVVGAITPLLGAVGLLSSALSAVSFKSLVDGIDALNDVKDATGASIENISALEDVAERTGTRFEDVSSALVKFNKALIDSTRNDDIAQILRSIGLSAEELKRVDPAEALRRTAVALSGYADDGNKARIIQVLFGKSVEKAAPFLKDLAEQGRLNAKVTTEQAQTAEDFNKQLFQLSKNLKDAARSIVSDLLPPLNELFKTLREASQQGAGGSLLDGILGTNPVARARADADAISAHLSRASDAFDRLAEAQRRGGGVGADSFLDARVEKARAKIFALQKDAAAASDKLKALADVMDGGAKPAAPKPDKPKPSAPDVPDTAGAEKAAAEALANLRKVTEGRVKAIGAAFDATRDALKFNEQYSSTLYAAGLESLEKYYADQDRARQDNLIAMRLATTREIVEREKLLKSPLLAGKAKAGDRQDVQNQIAEARAKLAAAERESGQAAQISLIDRQRATQALRDDVAALDAQIRDLASGRTADTDLLTIAQRVRDAGRLFVQGGASDEEAARRADEYGRLLEVQRQFGVVRENFATITDNAARAEELLMIVAERNGEGMLETEAKVRDVRAKAVEQIDELIAKTRELVELNPGDTALIKYLKDLELQAERARESMDPEVLRERKVAGEAGEAIARSFEDAVIEGGKLRDMIGSLDKDLTRLVMREYVTKPLATSITGLLNGAIGGATGGGGGGGGGGIGGLIGNLVGSLFGGGGAGFGSGAAFGAQDLGLFLDGGGYTGNKGVKEAAGVVHGQEFVFSAPATRRLGVDALETLHQAGRSGLLQGFEAGGLVGSPPPLRRAMARSGASAAGPSRAAAPSITNLSVNVAATPGMSRQTAMQQGVDIGRGIQHAMARGA